MGKWQVTIDEGTRPEPEAAVSTGQPLVSACRLPFFTYRSFCGSEKELPIFSRDWWLDIVCGEKNWSALLIEEKGRVIAAMPLFIPHPGIVSMPPFTQTMGPWLAPESADTKYTTALGKRQALLAEFVEKLKTWPHFLQNFDYRITDWLPFYWNGYRQTTRYTYLLPDIKNESLLWENLSSNIRRNILRAKGKKGIIIRKGVSVDDFLRIQALTFKRQKTKMKESPEILKKLITTCRQRNQGEIFGGYDPDGRLHAAAFVVWQESSAYYLAGGGDPALRDSGAHSLVLWEAIRYVSQYTGRFDFEGSMLPGVERFFREFGAVQTPFFTITKGKLSLLYRAWLKLGKRVRR